MPRACLLPGPPASSNLLFVAAEASLPPERTGDAVSVCGWHAGLPVKGARATHGCRSHGATFLFGPLWPSWTQRKKQVSFHPLPQASATIQLKTLHSLFCTFLDTRAPRTHSRYSTYPGGTLPDCSAAELPTGVLATLTRWPQRVRVHPSHPGRGVLMA